MRPHEPVLPTIEDPGYWGVSMVRHVFWVLLGTCAGLATLLACLGYLVKIDVIAEAPVAGIVTCPQGRCVDLLVPVEHARALAEGDAASVEMSAELGVFERRVVSAAVTRIGEVIEERNQIVTVALEPGVTGVPLRGLLVIGKTRATTALWPF